MPDICICLHVHEPFVLRRYSVFDSEPDYFDAAFTAERIGAMVRACYGPVNETLLNLTGNLSDNFKVALAISGLALELLAEYAPDTLGQFRELAGRPGVELLGETYYHSFSSLFSKEEFIEQVGMHRRMMQRMFGRAPRAFRATGLLPDAVAGEAIASLGYGLMLGRVSTDGPPGPSGAYHTVDGLRILTPHEILGRGFTTPTTQDAAEPPAGRAGHFLAAAQRAGPGHCNLFINYEMLSGAAHGGAGLRFLQALAQAAGPAGVRFVHPAETRDQNMGEAPITLPQPGPGRASAALEEYFGNAMQVDAAERLYAVRREMPRRPDGLALENWRRLTSADHLLYMGAAPTVAAGRTVSPFDSPYDAYIYFMNVLENLEARLRDARPVNHDR